MKKQSIVVGLAVGMLVAPSAMAQVAATAKAEAGTEDKAKAEATADDGDNPPEAEPEAEPAPEPAPAPEPVKLEETEEAEDEKAKGGSDHEKVVGRYAIGYLGLETMTLGADDPQEVTAPVLGGRHWFTDFVGLDLGFGVNFFGGRLTTNEDDVDDVKKIRQTTIILHAGVPLNFYDRGSFSFQVVPEANMGFAWTSDQDDTDDNKLRDKGFHTSVGARAGAEVQFGFIGIPELSLQGYIGLYRQFNVGSTVTVTDGDRVRVSDRTVTLSTGTGPDPWDLFAGSIAALYYF